MKQVPNTAFVAFNTRGVPGSSSAPPAAVDVAPPEFERKTLTGVFFFSLCARESDAKTYGLCVCVCVCVRACVSHSVQARTKRYNLSLSLARARALKVYSTKTYLNPKH
jgi:hypothetical protein